METVYSLILTYKYAILLPFTIIEGPIVNVIAAFLSSLGVLNIFAVYIICVFGDLLGDMLYYWIGRLGSHSIIPKYGPYLGITEERIKFAEEHYKKHLIKTILIGKITQAPILLIMVVAGITKTDFMKYLTTIFVVTIPKVLFFTVVGYYFGKSYVLIGQYIDNSLFLMAFILSSFAIIYFIFLKLRTRYAANLSVK